MKPLTVGSLFAGIGGFDLGFERVGCRVLWQAEQDGKAQSVLSARFPHARLYDDVKAIDGGAERVDVICGGFPCQDVSVAGKREGLKGERTGLFWEIVRIAEALKPRWMVLENVPGLLSSHGGRDFHTVLAALADCGFRRTYRILDSRYFGVAQRRRRVFLVLRARRCGDGPEAVLFEPTGGTGDSPPRGEAGARLAATLRGRAHGAGSNAPGRGGEDDENIVAFDNRWGVENANTPTLRSDCHGSQPMIAATLNSGGNDGGFRTEPGEHLIVPERERALVGSMFKRHDDDTDTLIPTLTQSMGHHGYGSDRGDGSSVIPFDTTQITSALNRSHPKGGDPCHPLTAGAHPPTIAGTGVRRLTPLECERLQGFPDGWTCLCGQGHRGSSFCTCADSPRYRQLGNAVTVNVAEWIARRIVEAEAHS